MGKQMNIEDRYAGFLHDLSLRDGPFSIVQIMKDHKVPAYIGAQLKRIGLTANAPRNGNTSSGTVWAGGNVSSHQLRKYAAGLLAQHRKYSRDYMKASRSIAKREVPAPSLIPSTPVVPSIPAQPAKDSQCTVTVNIAPRTVSILWGLFKFTL